VPKVLPKRRAILSLAKCGRLAMAGLLQPIPITSAESIPTNTLLLNEVYDSSRVVGNPEVGQKRRSGKFADYERSLAV
jgi:hypothetical protein